MSESANIVLWQLPTPSTSFWRGPWIEANRSAVRLYLPYETDGGWYDWGMLAFLGVFRLNFAHAFASSDHREAYDRLIEVKESAWACQTLAEVTTQVPSLKRLHHYRFHMDDVGCYDIVAEEWSFSPHVETPPANSLVFGPMLEPPRPST
ncbi:MAG: hypothetical protein IT562_11215 [Alphaproteobacteria bacterium]|nr:hypothetical protein [Alphaproteobacteria bacterium]